MKCLQLSCEEPGTLVCSRCKVAKYCGREHQRASWKEHKLTCQPPPITEYPTEPLFDVYANFERFVNPKPTPGLTLLFSSNRPLPAKPSKKKKTATITPTLEDFKTNFRGFTSSIFEGIPEPLFQNVLVAGGAVLACLLPPPKNYAELESVEYDKALYSDPKWNKPDPISNFFPLEQTCDDPQRKPQTLHEYYEKTRWYGADVDIFLYGLDEAAAVAKITALFDHFKSKLASTADTVYVRTPNTITLVSEEPQRHIQIIVRLYPDAATILNGFDIDCCCVGFDGNRVWATPRAIKAINTIASNEIPTPITHQRVNIIDLSIRGPFYEERLIKYATRGFAVSVPFLERSRIHKDVVLKVEKNTSGYGGGFDFDNRDLWYASRYLERLILAQDAFRLVPNTSFCPFPCRLRSCKDIISPDKVHRVKIALEGVHDRYPSSGSGTQDMFTSVGHKDLRTLLASKTLQWQGGSMEKAPMTIEAWSIYVYDSDPRREGRRFDVNIGGSAFRIDHSSRVAKEREAAKAEKEKAEQARKRKDMERAMAEARAEVLDEHEKEHKEKEQRRIREQRAYEECKMRELQERHTQELREAEAFYRGDDEERCAVCLMAAKDTIFLPCKHACACYECAIRLTECPLCRTAIEKAQRIYI